LSQNEQFRDLKFKYVTETQFNKNVSGIKTDIELSIFHLNIRSLNSKHQGLHQLLDLIDIDFDVVVLSEIWTTNVEFYSNILPDYNFYYDLPVNSTVGGVGIFIKKKFTQSLMPQYKIGSSDSNTVEESGLKLQMVVLNTLLVEYIGILIMILQNSHNCLNLHYVN
jgi:hypothetical protein